MCTIVIEALTPLNRTSCIKMYKNNARSRLFGRIAKKSIFVDDSVFSLILCAEELFLRSTMSSGEL